jgi:hypothetical protein
MIIATIALGRNAMTLDSRSDDVGGVVLALGQGLLDAATLDGAVEADPLEDLVDGLADRLGDEHADDEDEKEGDELGQEHADRAQGVTCGISQFVSHARTPLQRKFSGRA